MQKKTHATRRDFLKKSSAVAAGLALLNQGVPHVHAAENNTIPVALVGCGGRGTGAGAQALSTDGPTRLVAVADVYDFKCKATVEMLTETHGDKVQTPKDRQFTGFDSYKNAIDAVGPGGVVLLCTPPAFRPFHLEYAIEKGVHVFMEKSFAVDPQGVRRVKAAAKKADEKGLKIVTGLMCRHSVRLEETIKRIQDGMIGDIITSRVTRVQGPYPYAPQAANQTPLQHQLLNFNSFTWLCGSFILDWMIHNIDVCAWAQGEKHPVSVQGQGGRQVRDEKDQMLDHVALEYAYEDGRTMFLQLRQIPNTWNFVGTTLHGTKGTAVVGEGIGDPRLYKGYKQTRDNILWAARMPEVHCYQYEHDRLFKAIREDLPWNEAERGCNAVLTGVIGRMAAESGKEIHLKDQLNSNVELAPGIESLTMESDSLVMPDTDGTYSTSIPKPGITSPV